jgi:hypothetical protein
MHLLLVLVSFVLSRCWECFCLYALVRPASITASKSAPDPRSLSVNTLDVALEVGKAGKCLGIGATSAGEPTIF